jgi:RNA recognition motif-containing protein
MATKHKRDEDPYTIEPPSKKVSGPNGAVVGQSYPQTILYPPLSSTLQTTQTSGVDDPCNIFVKHLPPDLTDATLHSLFAPFGTIISARVMKNPTTNTSLGYGFVKFSTPEEANNAITHMSGVKVANKYLLVKHAETGTAKAVRQATVAQQTQQTSNLYAAAIQQQLQALYGDTLTPEQLAYYTAYYTQYYTQAARQQTASPGSSYNPAAPGTNLFIFHLPVDIDDNALRTLFSPFGAIESLKVVRDKMTGISKGYGFVKYVRTEDAVQAINTMNGFQIGNKYLKVTFKSGN